MILISQGIELQYINKGLKVLDFIVPRFWLKSPWEDERFGPQGEFEYCKVDKA